MYDLAQFTLGDMTRCGAAIRRLGAGSKSMEGAAVKIVRYLFDELGDGESGKRSCVLVRLYKTHPFGDLEPDLREFGRSLLPSALVQPKTKCLTLLGTAGDEPAWNSRKSSKGHKAIPLPSKHVVDEIPMIARLIRQFGIEVTALLEPKPEIIKDLDQKTYNVFYVADAKGSPYIPAQASFVVPHGVESALGFGGMLPDGNLFAVIMFARVSIPLATAEMFRTIALNVKLALLPLVTSPFHAVNGDG